MGALIILHGLFLLDCSMQSQQCYLLVAQATPHVYRVGIEPATTDIPASIAMTIDIPGVSGKKNPVVDKLEERTLLLDSSAVKVMRGSAVMMVRIPMPDYIYSANRVTPFREDLLNHSNSSIILNTKQQVTFGETLLLSYTQGGPFNLVNNGTVIQSSSVSGKVNAMAFYSWPRTCGTHPDHSGGVNQLLRTTGGDPVNLKLMGIGAPATIDDSGTTSFGLPDSVLRPPCMQSTTLLGAPERAKDGNGYVIKAEVHIFTATETGCGDIVVIEP